MTVHTLATSRLLLRPAELNDRPDLLAAGDEADEARVQRLHALIERNPIQFALHGYGLWVIHHGSRSVGWIGLRPRESAIEPELYYGLAPSARGMGFSTEAAAAVIERLFHSPSVTGVWAVTDPDNLPSRRVLERLGMRLELEGEFDAQPSCVYRLLRPQASDPAR